MRHTVADTFCALPLKLSHFSLGTTSYLAIPRIQKILHSRSQYFNQNSSNSPQDNVEYCRCKPSSESYSQIVRQNSFQLSEDTRLCSVETAPVSMPITGSISCFVKEELTQLTFLNGASLVFFKRQLLIMQRNCGPFKTLNSSGTSFSFPPQNTRNVAVIIK